MLALSVTYFHSGSVYIHEMCSILSFFASCSTYSLPYDTPQSCSWVFKRHLPSLKSSNLAVHFQVLVSVLFHQVTRKKKGEAFRRWTEGILLPWGRLLLNQSHSCVNCTDLLGHCQPDIYRCGTGKRTGSSVIICWQIRGRKIEMCQHPCLLSVLPQIQESMEPERTAQGLPAALGPGEMTGGSAESCKHRSTMQDIFSEIQSLVERSNIINVSINWF